MKSQFSEYKPFLLFLGKFFGTYLVLIFLYQCYLSGFENKNEVDGFTTIVSEHTRILLSIFDNQSFTRSNPNEASVKMYYHNEWVARIIEGCNSLSVIVLFISFVVAFSGNFKKTILFILSGIVIIYIFNVVRIALLCMAIYHYPKSENLLHNVLFPLVIYGVVFGLWIVWVNKFSFYAEKTKK